MLDVIKKKHVFQDYMKVSCSYDLLHVVLKFVFVPLSQKNQVDEEADL